MAFIAPILTHRKDGHPWVIRVAEPRHASSIRDLRMDLAREDAWTATTVDEVKSAQRIAMETQRTLTSRGSIWLVGENDEGTLLGEVEIRANSGVKRAHVGTLTIGVRADSRGLGCGRALCQAAIAWAEASQQFFKISLAVFANNLAAKSLYKSLGFSVEGVRKSQVWCQSEGWCDDILMAVFFQPPIKNDTKDRSACRKDTYT